MCLCICLSVCLSLCLSAYLAVCLVRLSCLPLCYGPNARKGAMLLWKRKVFVHPAGIQLEVYTVGGKRFFYTPPTVYQQGWTKTFLVSAKRQNGRKSKGHEVQLVGIQAGFKHALHDKWRAVDEKDKHQVRPTVTTIVERCRTRRHWVDRNKMAWSEETWNGLAGGRIFFQMGG